MHACIQSSAGKERRKVLENEHVVATICWHPTTLLDLTRTGPVTVEALPFYSQDPLMLPDLTMEFTIFFIYDYHHISCY